MKKVNNYFKNFLIGIAIGNLVELFISIMIGKLTIGAPSFVNNQSSPLVAKIIQTVLYGGFGIIGLMGKNMKSENILKSTLAHITVFTIYFLIVGYYLKWYQSLTTLLIALFIWLAIYLIIWLAFYLQAKKEVDKINRELNKKK